MIDARIPVEIGLKGYFGSILAAMGSSTPVQGLSTLAPPARLMCTFPWAQAHSSVQHMSAILFHLELGFQSLTWTRRLTYDLPRFFRASRILLIPINTPLNIEERYTAT
jgi:hypothetical protein